MSLEFAAGVVIQVGAAIIMFCMGVGLRWGDLTRVLERPAVVGVGLLLQAVAMPLVAIAMCRALGVEPILASGLVLVAACPISTPSNLLTRLASGPVATSVTLTALTALLSAVTIPLAMALMANLLPGSRHIELPSLWRMAWSLLGVPTVPVLLGMVFCRVAPARAAACERGLMSAASAAFVLGLGITVAAAVPVIPSAMLAAGPYALLLNVVGCAVAYGVTTGLGFDARDRVAIVLGTGTRKFSFVAVVALAVLHDVRLLMPGVAYGLIMWLTAGVVVAVARRSLTNPVARATSAVVLAKGPK